MANDAYFISNTIQAQERVRAALSLLFPDADALKIIPPHRRGVPYTNMVNWTALADFLADRTNEIEVKVTYNGTTVDNDAVEQADAGEIDMLTLNRAELIEVAKARGIEIVGTGMSGYIRRDDALKALGVNTDEPDSVNEGNNDDDSIKSGEAVSS